MIRDLEPGDQEWTRRMLDSFFAALDEMSPGAFASEAGEIYARLYVPGPHSPGDKATAEIFARVFEADDAPRAFLLGRISRRPARLPPEILLLDAAYTEPAYRGRGIMDALYQDARRWCRERAIERLELSTPVAGPARAYWERRGFAGRFVSMEGAAGE